MNDYTDYLHSDLTDKILNAAWEVYNTLGAGFLESVYENALAYELELRGFEVVKQCPIEVYYKTKKVGQFFADIVVNDIIILELKAVSQFEKIHEVQLKNYLKSTYIELGLLLNFGNEDKLRIKRKIFTNDRKVNLNQ